MTVKINISIPDLEKVIESQNLIREVTKGQREEISPEQLKELVRVAHDYSSMRPDFDLLNYQPYCGACGCLGPRDNDSMCPCRQAYMLEAYRFEVALLILTT